MAYAIRRGCSWASGLRGSGGLFRSTDGTHRLGLIRRARHVGGDPWLKERYRAEIIAVTMDRDRGTSRSVRDRALAAGAVRAHVLDLRESVTRSYVRACAEGRCALRGSVSLPTALGRPLVAQKLVEIAGIERAAAVAHGLSAGQRSVRLDVASGRSVRSQGHRACSRVGMTRLERSTMRGSAAWSCRPRPTARTARTHTIGGRSIECGVLEIHGMTPGCDLHADEGSAECPAEPAYVEIAFDCGAPAAVNGVAMPLLDLISSLGTIAARTASAASTWWNRLSDQVSRGLRAPAATLLHRRTRSCNSWSSPGPRPLRAARQRSVPDLITTACGTRRCAGRSTRSSRRSRSE